MYYKGKLIKPGFYSHFDANCRDLELENGHKNHDGWLLAGCFCLRCINLFRVI